MSDPLEDTPARGPGPNGCPAGGQCDGSGWVFVSRHYAEGRAGELSAEQLALIEDPDVRAVAEVRSKARLAASANTVYPCKACNPGPFYLWAGGHYDAGHDPAGCTECRERLGTKVARRESKKVAAHG